jgi:hypothetical protein
MSNADASNEKKPSWHARIVQFFLAGCVAIGGTCIKSKGTSRGVAQLGHAVSEAPGLGSRAIDFGVKGGEKLNVTSGGVARPGLSVPEARTFGRRVVDVGVKGGEKLIEAYVDSKQREDQSRPQLAARGTTNPALGSRSRTDGFAVPGSRSPIGAGARFTDWLNARAAANRGKALLDSGDLPGAIAAYREAIRLQPDLAAAHSNLGGALRDSGDLPGAIEACREAIRRQPDLAVAHCCLGLCLRDRGEYAEALAELRTGHDLGSKRPDWRYPSADWVRQAERKAARAGRLPAVPKVGMR